MAGPQIGLIVNSIHDTRQPNFFVPTEKLASARLRDDDRVGANAIYLGSFKFDQLDPKLNDYFLQLRSKYKGISFLFEIEVRKYNRLGDLTKFLSAIDSVELQLSIVMIVPAMEDLEYWAALRDYNGHLRFGLKLVSLLSLDFVARYKTLAFDVIFAKSKCFIDIAVEMAVKTSPPDIIIEKDDPFGTLVNYAKRVVPLHAIEPYSDMLIDPLQPLTTEMDMDVYENFETDRVKYYQYDAAIEEAIGDFRRKSTSLSILVIGPGRGRLLQSVLIHRGPDDRVVAVEKNRKCMDLLVEVVRDHENVKLYCGDVRNLQNDNYDLVISELLGSFGCNEACPEILQHLTNSSLIFIPFKYSSGLQPIYTDLLLKNITRPYLVSLNSWFPVGEISWVFGHRHTYTQLNLEMTFTIQRRLGVYPNIDFANALLGYFHANLYKFHCISVLPQARLHEKCESWYPMIFPIGKAEMGDEVTMRRRSDGQKMWYEWKVGDRLYNVGGTYSVALH